MTLHTKRIARILGLLMVLYGAAMLVPMVLAALMGESEVTLAFLVPGAFSIAMGSGLWVTYRFEQKNLSLKDGMILLTAGWLYLSLWGAQPYLMLKITDPATAFFESVSAITTTGASAIADVESLPLPLLLWRSFCQWLGGLGVLIFLQMLLPSSYENQSALIQTDRDGDVRRSLLRRSSSSGSICALYCILTAAEMVMLKFCGLKWFDAVAFSLGSTSSGGFAPYNDRLLSVTTPAVDAVLALFMILSCVNYSLYVFLLKKRTDPVKSNTELKVFAGILLGSSALLTLDLFLTGTCTSLGQALHQGGFQSVSFLATTGIVNTDVSQWPAFAKMLLTLLGLVGGCAASTGGGLKIIRLAILSKIIWRNFTTRIHPNAVVAIKINRKPLPSHIANSVVSYTLTWAALLLAGAFLLSFDAADYQSAFTACGAMLSNIGAGFGQMGNFAQYGSFSAFSKAVLCILMLAGRLEIYAILLPFTRSFWKEKV